MYTKLLAFWVLFATCERAYGQKCFDTVVGTKLFMFCGNQTLYRRNATAAQKECKRNGGNLVTILSKDDQRLVEDLVGTLYACDKTGGDSTELVYIGFNDVEQEGNWTWHGESIPQNNSYRNWKKGKSGGRDCLFQPNGGTNCSAHRDQDYVAIQRCVGENNNYGKWFDVDGTKKLAFLCEIFLEKRRNFTNDNDRQQAGRIGSGDSREDIQHKNTDVANTITSKTRATASSIPRSRHKPGSGRIPGDDNRRGASPDINKNDGNTLQPLSWKQETKMTTLAPRGKTSRGSATSDKTTFQLSTLTQETIMTTLAPGGKTSRGSATLGRTTFQPSHLQQKTKMTTLAPAEKTSRGSETSGRTTFQPSSLTQEAKTATLAATRTTPSGSATSDRNIIQPSSLKQEAKTTTLASARKTPRGSTTSDIEYFDGSVLEKDDKSVEGRLKCLMYSMQKPTSNSAVSERDYCGRTLLPRKGNPVQRLEAYVAFRAAELMIGTKHAVKARIGGMTMKVIPISNASKLLRFRSRILKVKFSDEKGCDGCDSAELNKNILNELSGQIIVVSAALYNEMLEGTGVYDAPLEKEVGSEFSQYDSEHFVDAATPVISISVFQSAEDGTLVRRSLPANTIFNISSDVSEAMAVRKDPGRIVRQVERTCVYLDQELKWSAFGCQTILNGQSSVRCECNHTTPFAVMVSLKSFKIPLWETYFLLSTELIGVIFLCFTLCMLLWVRKSLRKDRVLTQINLTLALLLMHVSMVIAAYVSSIPGLCVFFTLMSHFFMIASAMWMLNEGLVLYKKTCSSALNFDIGKLQRWLFLIGWVLPGIYVIICLGTGLGLKKYIDTTIGYEVMRERTDKTLDDIRYERCGLSTRHRMVLAGVIPIAVCLCVVVYFLVRVSAVIWRMNVQSRVMMPSDVRKRHSALKSTTKAVALLVPVLGIPWILAFLVNVSGAELVFAAIHGVANGLQGVVFFVVYIVVNRETRNSAKRRISTKSLSSSKGTGRFSVSSSISYFARSKKTRRSEAKSSSATNSQASPLPSPSLEKMQSTKTEIGFSSID